MVCQAFWGRFRITFCFRELMAIPGCVDIGVCGMYLGSSRSYGKQGSSICVFSFPCIRGSAYNLMFFIFFQMEKYARVCLIAVIL